MKRLISKTITLIVVLAIYNIFIQTISPIVANELAMNQMQNTLDSSFWIQVYTHMGNFKWVLFIVLTTAIFYKDILRIVKRVKEKINEEN